MTGTGKILFSRERVGLKLVQQNMQALLDCSILLQHLTRLLRYGGFTKSSLHLPAQGKTIVRRHLRLKVLRASQRSNDFSPNKFSTPNQSLNYITSLSVKFLQISIA